MIHILVGWTSHLNVYLSPQIVKQIINLSQVHCVARYNFRLFKKLPFLTIQKSSSCSFQECQIDTTQSQLNQRRKEIKLSQTSLIIVLGTGCPTIGVPKVKLNFSLIFQCWRLILLGFSIVCGSELFVKKNKSQFQAIFYVKCRLLIQYMKMYMSEIYAYQRIGVQPWKMREK